MNRQEHVDVSERWSNEKAWQWHRNNAWLCGFNYLPRTAVNFVDMWMHESFDAGLIRQELTWAKAAGYNAIRTNLPYIVWVNDRDGLFARIDQFLELADQLGFSVMLCPLDDCEFSGSDPVFGPQPEPDPHVHNSRAVGSPGRNNVIDPAERPKILRYIQDLISTYADDRRVNIWDLYNEPSNPGTFSGGQFTEFQGPLYSSALALLRQVFTVARECKPSQPLTVGCWRMPPETLEGQRFFDDDIDQTALALSDVISFHAYCDKATLERIISQLADDWDRPMLCTEWMARHVESRIEEQLPIFHDQKIGCYQWGLVAGATQTYLPWPNVRKPSPETEREGELWFHDVFRSDGTPFDEREIAVLRTYTAAESS